MSKADELRWQAEDDVRTLVRAEEIRKDKDRLRRARALAKKQAKAAADAAAGM